MTHPTNTLTWPQKIAMLSYLVKPIHFGNYKWFVGGLEGQWWCYSLLDEARLTSTRTFGFKEIFKQISKLWIIYHSYIKPLSPESWIYHLGSLYSRVIHPAMSVRWLVGQLVGPLYGQGVISRHPSVLPYVPPRCLDSRPQINPPSPQLSSPGPYSPPHTQLYHETRPYPKVLTQPYS